MIIELLSSGSFWAPVATSSVLIGMAGAILSPWYRGRIEKGIQHKFDGRLEDLRSALRRDEEKLKADLRQQDEKIATLRAGALAQMNSRRVGLDQRRLVALERLWAAVVALAPAKGALRMTSVMNMPEVIKRSESGQDAEALRKVGDMMWQTAQLDKMSSEMRVGDQERPFVGALTWAIFSAYKSALMIPVVQLGVVRAGAGPKTIVDDQTLIAPILAAMPEWKDYLDKFGLSGLHAVVDAMEEKLLTEIRRDLEGAEADSSAVSRAAEIVKAADAFADALAAKVEVPDLARRP